MIGRRAWAFLGLLVSLPAMAPAADWEVGVLAGARFDGEYRDPVDLSRIPLDASGALGAFGRIGLGPGTGASAEVFWTTARASLDTDRASSVPGGLELRIDHFQAGLQLDLGEGPLRPFVGVSAGVSRFRPSSGGAEPAYAFSLGGVVGAHWTYRDRLRVRLEGRGFGARPDREGGLFCSNTEAGVCSVRNPDRLLLQSQLAVGVSVVF